MKAFLSTVAILLAMASGALAQTRPLGAPQLRANGDLLLGPTFKLGRQESDGRVILQPNAMQILGTGSTGDVSSTSVKAPGAPGGQPLSTWMTTPSFVAASSPLPTDAYASNRKTGQAAFSFRSSDGTSQVGTPEYFERYAGFFAYDGPGTGVPDVIGSSFGLGVSNTKQNWFNSTVPGQSIGLQIVTRGGYHGPLMTTAPTAFGGYYPGGDVTGMIINSVQSSAYAQNAAGEFSIHYAEGGRFDASGNIHSINVQLAPMKQKNPDGSSANPGIGLVLTASAGDLGYAIQAVNTARPGSFNNNTPGHWAGFARYSRDNGTKAYDAWRVDQDGSIYMAGSGTTTPAKKIRIGSSGEWQVANNAGATVLSLTDAGGLTVGTGASARAVQTVPGAWTPYNGALQFDSDSTAAGTFNARYEIVGKKLTLTALYNVTSVGATGGSALHIPLPASTAVAVACPGVGNEYAATGKTLTARAIGGATRLTVINYDNTSPVSNNAQGMVNIVCELQ